jgi:hypothetical protein
MIPRLISLMLAVCLGLPLCRCCWEEARPLAAASPDEPLCPACEHVRHTPAHTPASPTPVRPCCLGLTERTVSPDAVTAPRLVLVDLQAWVWTHSQKLPLPSWREFASLPVDDSVRARSWHGPPLYQRDCALLL